MMMRCDEPAQRDSSRGMLSAQQKRFLGRTHPFVLHVKLVLAAVVINRPLQICKRAPHGVWRVCCQVRWRNWLSKDGRNELVGEWLEL